MNNKEDWVADKHYFSIYDMCGDLANAYICINTQVNKIYKKYPNASQFRIDFEHDEYQDATQGVIHFLRLAPAKKRSKPRRIGCSHRECKNKP